MSYLNVVVLSLVAHHSGAQHVAALLGLEPQLRRYDDPAAASGPLAEAVTWADQTTSPAGLTIDVATRLTEMLVRHGPDSPNARVHAERGPAIEQAVAATTDRLLLRRAQLRLSRH